MCLSRTLEINSNVQCLVLNHPTFSSETNANVCNCGSVIQSSPIFTTMLKYLEYRTSPLIKGSNDLNSEPYIHMLNPIPARNAKILTPKGTQWIRRRRTKPRTSSVPPHQVRSVQSNQSRCRSWSKINWDFQCVKNLKPQWITHFWILFFSWHSCKICFLSSYILPFPFLEQLFMLILRPKICMTNMSMFVVPLQTTL